MHPPAPATGQEEKDAPGTSGRRRWPDALIVVFATFHALRLLAGLVPEQKRPDPLPLGLGPAYEKLTGSRQHWNMFDTIPSLNGHQARIIITGRDGSTRQLGPLLPGFRAYSAADDPRLFVLFTRMIDDSAVTQVFESYLRSVDRALRIERRIKPGEIWRLEVDEDYTRLLANIRKDGKMFQRKTRQFELPSPSVSAP